MQWRLGCGGRLWLGGVLPDGWAAGYELLEVGEPALVWALAEHRIDGEVHHPVLHQGDVGGTVFVLGVGAAYQQELLGPLGPQVGVEGPKGALELVPGALAEEHRRPAADVGQGLGAGKEHDVVDLAPRRLLEASVGGEERDAEQDSEQHRASDVAVAPGP